jgi:predicted PurR-regulated permease PerM
MKKPSSIIPLLVGIASLFIVVAGLRAMAPLLGPVLLSLFIVLVSNPIMVWLHRRGLPGWLAYTLVVLGVITIGLVFILFLAVSISQLSSALPTYQNLIDERLSGLEQWLAQYKLQIEDVFKLSWFNPENILKTLLAFVQVLLGAVSNIGFTLLVFIYMLASAANFSIRLRHGLADNMPLLQRFSDVSHSIGTYLLIKSWLGAMTALLQVILMWVLGVDFAVLWGVLSFLFNFVPNIGFYIALIPPVLLSLITLGLGKTVILIVGYILINNLFDILVAPRYLGKGLDLSTLVTFLAVVFWAWVLGLIGAFMALPLTVMVKKLVLESFSDTQLLAKLISSGTNEQSAE